MAIPNIATEAKQSGSVSLTGFVSQNVLGLTLDAVPVDPDDPNPPSKHFVIWGRVVIRNLDGSPQNAGATLTTTAGDIDRVDVRIAQDDSTPDPGQSGGQTLSLMARLDLAPFSPFNSVTLTCATYNGFAEEARIIAITVDGF